MEVVSSKYVKPTVTKVVFSSVERLASGACDPLDGPPPGSVPSNCLDVAPDMEIDNPGS